MAQFALGWLLGVWICQFQESLPAPAWGFLCLPLLGLLLRFPRFRFLLSLPLALLWSSLYAHWLADDALAPGLVGVDVPVSGHIAQLPEPRGEGQRLVFTVDGETEPGVPARLRLNWYDPPVLKVGERWALVVRLRRPRGLANPGGFDLEQTMFRQGIGAIGYVREKPPPQRVATASVSIDGLRQQLRDGFTKALAGSSMTGIAVALAVGDRSLISKEQWRVLTATGTNHLVAISGLHVGLVAGLVFFLVRGGWARLGNLPLYCPAPVAAAAAAMLAALGYSALAGFAIPTQRALVMTSVVMLSLMLRRRLVAADVLGLALWLVLLLDPLAILSGGFWLSFGAVAAIFYAMGGRRQQSSRWLQWGRLQWTVSLALAPLLLLLFQQVSLISPLANLMAVPWVGFVVVPAVLLTAVLLPLSPVLSGYLLSGVAVALEGLWWLLEYFAGLPLAVWQHGAPPWWMLPLAGVGLALLLAPRGLPGRWLGLLWLLPAFTYQPPRPAPGAFDFYLLDVGQGLAAVVQTHRHVLLFDAGPVWRGGFDTGESVVVPFLRRLGEKRLDTLIVSHSDGDHSGGAAAVLRQMGAGEILAGQPARLSANGVKACRRGQRWQWDGVTFEMLHPGERPAGEGGDNERSCVLKVSTVGGSLLLPADIEAAAEAELLTTYGKRLAAEVLVAPHHGSLTSSSEAFIDAVSPNWVLFAVGHGNRFGLPRREVVSRYAARGINMADTAQAGAMGFRFGPDGVASPRLYRHDYRRYWHGT